jgi:ribonucleoside-diphosphate reductase alpha chain
MTKLKRRPGRLPGFTVKVKTSVGTAFVTLTFDGSQPAEVFVSLGKGGSESFAIAEALGRLISAMLRLEELGTPQERLDIIVDQLKGIGGLRSGARVRSVPDALAYVLEGGSIEPESSSPGPA